MGLERTVAFITAPADQSQNGSQQQTPSRMVTGGRAHHCRLRRRPVALIAEQANVAPLPQGRQATVLGLCLPQCCSFRETQFRPAASGLLSLTSQPGPEGWNEIVVSELVVFFAKVGLGRLALAVYAFGIGRRKQ